MQEAYAKADDVLRGAVQGISDIIMKKGHINVDFADVKTVMSEKGIAMMGTGRSNTKDRGRDAAELAVGSELLEDINLKDARGVVLPHFLASRLLNLSRSLSCDNKDAATAGTLPAMILL